MQTVVGCCQEEINWVRYGAVLKKKMKKGRKEENPPLQKRRKKKKVLGDSMRLPPRRLN